MESVTAPTPIAPAASLPDADVGPSAEAIQQTPPAQPPNSITDHHSIEYASCDTNSCDTSHLLADQQKPETDRVDDPPATPASLTENLKHEAAPVAQQQLPGAEQLGVASSEARASARDLQKAGTQPAAPAWDSTSSQTRTDQPGATPATTETSKDVAEASWAQPASEMQKQQAERAAAQLQQQQADASAASAVVESEPTPLPCALASPPQGADTSRKVVSESVGASPDAAPQAPMPIAEPPAPPAASPPAPPAASPPVVSPPAPQPASSHAAASASSRSADDDGLAALLLGFGAASRQVAPAPPPASTPPIAARYNGACLDDGVSLSRPVERSDELLRQADSDAQRGGDEDVVDDVDDVDESAVGDDSAVGDADDDADNDGGGGGSEIRNLDDYLARRREPPPPSRLSNGSPTQESSTHDRGDDESEPPPRRKPQGKAATPSSKMMGLQGVSPRDVVGGRLEVVYMERQGKLKQRVPVPYRGSVVALDPKKGLRIKLDGYVRREWVTDEDEWVWLPTSDDAPLAHQRELADKSEEQELKKKKTPLMVASGRSAPAAAAVSSAQVTGTGAGALTVSLILGGVHKLTVGKEVGGGTRRGSAGAPRSREKPSASKAQPVPSKDAAASAQMPAAPSSAAADSGEQLTVTIAAGPHMGVVAKVIHVGNGWVKLQLPSGAVVHLRKVDLDGNIPLKSKTARISAAELSPESQSQPDAKAEFTAGGLTPEPMVEPVEAPVEAGTQRAAKVVAAAAVASSSSSAKRQAEPSSAASKRQAVPSAGGSHKKAAPSQEAPRAANGGVEASVVKSSAPKTSAPKDSAPKDSAPKDSSDSEAKAEPKKSATKKHRRVEVLCDGLEIGSAVWARWSGIKFSHGTIHKLPSSSKWVSVLFDGDTLQWVTLRDLVPDETPERAAVTEGVEVIAAWPEEEYYYKGSVVGEPAKPGGLFRVRYDDWDEQEVELEQIRLLPATYGNKKKRPVTDATDTSEKVSLSKRSDGDSTKLGGATEGFVRAAREQLAKDPQRLQTLTELLAMVEALEEADASGAARRGGDGDAARVEDAGEGGDAPVAVQLRTLLEGYPALLKQLTALLRDLPAHSADTKSAEPRDEAPAAADASRASEAASEAEASAGAEEESCVTGGSKSAGEARGHETPRVRPADGSAAPLAASSTKRENGGRRSPRSPESAPPHEVLQPHDGAEANENGVHDSGGRTGVHERGPKGKGVRELSKLLHDFGGGSMVGVEIGSKTRQRGSLPMSPVGEAESSSPKHSRAEQISSAPFKKRPILT